MDRVALVRPTLADIEIAIVQLDNKEHDALHAGPKDWVNKNKVFPKPVSSVEMLPHPSTGPNPTATGWIVVAMHYPHCAVISACVQV